MKSIQFIFGIHNHQPIGNFDFVFEEAYQNSYLPFIEVVENHPNISLSLHYSGCLLEWLEDRHPNFLDRISQLVERGNIEILSAGFYEPILAVIPDHDKAGQLQKMNDYIRKRFNYKPTGLWLTERVWEPHLAKPIHDAGIEYIAVDDFHFLSGGKRLDELDGYFNTDEQGKAIGVFPISQSLRYAMPFQEPEVTIDFLREQANEEGDRAIVMADDGEKFGVWPGTHDRCFGKPRWLERFFQALEENQDWIKTTTFKEYYRSHAPRGRTYLPTVSYFEMSEWTLPADSGSDFSNLVHDFEQQETLEKYRPFLRGGTWRNFLSLYDESNWMHKRMIDTSYRLNDAAKERKFNGQELQVIRDNLWRAQCNCAYWHGIFGGLYLPHLRHSIFAHLLKAERRMDGILGNNHSPRDIDNDGALEFHLNSPLLKLIVGQVGGCIREFDIISKNFNLLDTMRRYRESYHWKVLEAEANPDVDGSIHNIVTAKEPNLGKYLQVDRWPRQMLMDHFVPRRTSLKRMIEDIPEKGNLLEAIYQIKQNRGLTLTGTGSAFGQAVQVQKQLELKENLLNISIRLTNQGSHLLAGLYGSEMNFALLGGHTPDRYYEINGEKPNKSYLDAAAIERAVTSVGIVNEWDGFRVTVNFPIPVNVWRFPVHTVSMSESGFEKVYQSSVLIPHWKISLRPNTSMTMRLDIKVEEWDPNNDKDSLL